MGHAINVAELIDKRPINSAQALVFVFSALTALLDGADSQVIGVAAPLMATEFQMTMAHFTPAFSAGLLGATIGSMTVGPIADLLGRKRMLVATTAIMGLCTIFTAFSGSFFTLLIWRFLAGIGLGGAIPCFMTLSAEYAPKAYRATLAGVLYAGYPLGNSIGGFLSSYLIHRYHWTSLFFVVGVPTLILSAAIMLFAPESLLYLVKTRKVEQARRTIGKVYPDLSVGATQFVFENAGESPRANRVPVMEFFRQGRALGTVLLWAILFLAFATTTIIVLMTPALLRQAGVDLSTTAMLIGIYSIGAVIGMALGGHLVTKLGPVAALTPAFFAGAALLGGLGSVTSSVPLLGLCMLLLGFTAPLSASGALALATIYYPTEMRSAGIGWGMGFGRLGQVSSPLLTGLFLGFGWQTQAILSALALIPLLGGFAVIFRTLLLGKSGTAQIVN